MAIDRHATDNDGARRASTTLHDAADDFRASASEMLDEAKTTASSRLNEQKDVAADGIDRLADSLRHNANADNDSGHRDPLGGIADSAAQGLERLSHTLRNKDVGDMVRDVESFARSQPVAFFGLAVAGGFLAVRFLKSSERATDGRPSTGRGVAHDRPLSTTRPHKEDAWTTP